MSHRLYSRFVFANLILAMFFSLSYAQQKHALLVGVGDHIYRSHSLLGPKNDVPAFRNLLIEKYGFKSENIEVLQDSDATRSNITVTFERRLVAPVSEGDLALFYFTGHGTQVTDYSGDEPDRRDEAFVPYDGKTMSTLLIDDDLAKLINRIKTREVVVILDACHSGTGTRGVARAKRITAKELGIEDAPDLSDSWRDKDKSIGEELTHALVISAARADQIAADYPFLVQESTANKNVNPNMGALTYYLLQAAWSDKNNKLTYEGLTEQVRAELGENGFEQTPQLEGLGQNPFLMLAPEPTSPPVSVSPDTLTLLAATVHAEVLAVHENEVTIQARGGAQLAPGSIFETIDQTINHEPNAIRLTASSGQTAIGQVLKGRVEAGDRLVETFHFVPQSKLRLAVLGDSALVQKVSMNLATLDFVEIVNKDDFRDVEFEVHSTPDSVSITPYRNQHRLPDIVVRDEDSVSDRTRPLLENLFAVNLLSNLKNPNPSFNVDVQVNGKDYSEIGVGSQVRFTVEVERDAYVYLVDVDPAGKVTVLFPNMYAKDSYLKGGTSYEMPAPKLYRLHVSGPAGPELVKAIATTKALKLDILTSDSGDFSGLDESAVDVARAIVDQLKREVNRSYTRGIVVLPAASLEQPIATEGWTSDSVLLRVLE